MKVELKDLVYVLMPGENVPAHLRSKHAEAYRTWKEVWSGAFQELGESPKLFGEGFSRQTEVGALFHKDECVALTCFHQVNFEEPTTREDSYFQYWTDDDIRKLTRDGQDVLICNNLTVSKNYRGDIAEGLPTKYLISQLSSMHLIDTGLPVMTGAMRRARGAHKAALGAGATYLSTGVGLYGWELDMVAFYRKEILDDRSCHEGIWLRDIWRRREDYSPNSTTSLQNGSNKKAA